MALAGLVVSVVAVIVSATAVIVSIIYGRHAATAASAANKQAAHADMQAQAALTEADAAVAQAEAAHEQVRLMRRAIPALAFEVLREEGRRDGIDYELSVINVSPADIDDVEIHLQANEPWDVAPTLVAGQGHHTGRFFAGERQLLGFSAAKSPIVVQADITQHGDTWHQRAVVDLPPSRKMRAV